MSKSKTLQIQVNGQDVLVKWDDGMRTGGMLSRKPLLGSIAKLVRDPHQIKAIAVQIQHATFSATRQVVAVVNTLAWQLGVKVNGKRRMAAKYDREPNITVRTTN